MPGTFPAIKLTYFAAAGRAEAARLAFYLGGVPFVDDRISHQRFAEIKKDLPLGQLPVLEVDGELLTQAQAILRFAGRLGGMYPPASAPLAAARVDELLVALAELEEKMSPAFHEKDPETKKSMREELARVTIPRYARLLEARLGVLRALPLFGDGDSLLIHHLAIYAWVKSLRAGYIDHIPVTVLDGYALINAAHDRVAAHPKVIEWYALQHHVPSLKLTYFNVPARAEPIRLALFAAGIQFEDVRPPRDELLARRPEFPYEQVPVLEVDGGAVVLAQSLAILRYVGSLGGLYSHTDAREAVRVDEVLALIDEMYNHADWPASYHGSEPERLAVRRRMAEGPIARCFDFVSRRIEVFGGPYAAGKRLTVADFAIYGLVLHFTNKVTNGVFGVPVTLVDAYPKLKRIAEQVAAHPKVVEWYTLHPLRPE
ncbi:hypothetical protein HK405_008070 [Cladochytrium tenue]|nr:hypothetical protein HK405_008070 [Cladochytrium tenue]